MSLRLPLDVTDPIAIASATQEVVRRFRRIDVLVNQELRPEVIFQVVQSIEAAKSEARNLVTVPFSQRGVLHLGNMVQDALFRRKFKISHSAK